MPSHEHSPTVNDSESPSDDKDNFEHVDRVREDTLTLDPSSGFDEHELVRKLDWYLVPWLSFLYLLSFLDRTNIGNAKLYGLTNDIKIKETDFNYGLMIFFFPYALFKVPSNILLRRLRPSIWLSLTILLWGIMMVVQGLIHDRNGLLGTRFMLGFFEAGLFPGVSYYLSSWYKRSEIGIRAAVFFSAATASGAFGGLLAAAIANMGGVGGKPSWAWIFILEGLVTVIAGAASFWIVQDFPNEATFLKPVEREAVIQRLQVDDQFSAAGETLQARHVWAAVLDWRTWLCMLVYVGGDAPLYAFALFLPSIINELGYTATKANLLSVPVYMFACMSTVLVGYIGDRYRRRGYLTTGCLLFAGIGYVILELSRSPGFSYAGTYLAAAGIYPIIPNNVAWISNNVEGSYKRGVTLAMVIGFGNINGAVSSNIYRARDRPWYPLGHGIVLAYIGIGVIASVLLQILLYRENARRDRGERDEVIGDNDGEPDSDKAVKNGVFATVEEAKKEKGDRWSGYRYTL